MTKALAGQIHDLLRKRSSQAGAFVFRGRIRVMLEDGSTDDLFHDEAEVYLAWLVERAAKPRKEEGGP
jgi:hypothetical protein